MQANVLVRWIVLMPAELKSENHINLLNEIIRQAFVAGNIDLNFVYDMVNLELTGSGSLAILLSKGNWTSGVLADSAIQFAAFRKTELSKIFRVLFKSYKTIKCYELVEEAVKKLSAQNQTQQIQDIFVKFVKTILFTDMARDIFYLESERIIKAIVSNEKVQLTGTLNYEEFNWLVTNLNRNFVCEHILLLKTLAKRCLPANMIDTFVKYLDDSLEAAQNLYKTTDKLPTSAKDLTATNRL